MKLSPRIFATASLIGLACGLFYLAFFHISDPFYSDVELNKRYHVPLIFWIVVVPAILILSTGLGALAGFIIYRLKKRREWKPER